IPVASDPLGGPTGGTQSTDVAEKIAPPPSPFVTVQKPVGTAMPGATERRSATSATARMARPDVRTVPPPWRKNSASAVSAQSVPCVNRYTFRLLEVGQRTGIPTYVIFVVISRHSENFRGHLLDSAATRPRPCAHRIGDRLLRASIVRALSESAAPVRLAAWPPSSGPEVKLKD